METHNALIGQHLRNAMIFVHLAQNTNAPEMLAQYLREVERLLEFSLGNISHGDGTGVAGHPGSLA